MENKIKHTKLFGKNGHLNEEGLALYTEALIDDTRFLLLPEHVLEHVEECFECKEKVIEFYELIKNEDDIVKIINQQKNGNNLEVKHFKKQKVRKISGLRVNSFAIAACLILIFAVSYILLFVVQPNHEKLFENYFKPYPNIITEKGNKFNEDELFNFGMYYYDLEKYDTAILVFNKLMETDSTNETILFYCGISYLELDKDSEAARIFRTLQQNEYHKFAEQVKWYLALSYIKQNYFEKAIPILEELICDKGYYSDKAGEILSEIE